MCTSMTNVVISIWSFNRKLHCFTSKHINATHRMLIEVSAPGLDQVAGPKYHYFRANIDYKIWDNRSRLIPYICDLFVRTHANRHRRTTSFEIATSSEVTTASLRPSPCAQLRLEIGETKGKLVQNDAPLEIFPMVTWTFTYLQKSKKSFFWERICKRLWVKDG